MNSGPNNEADILASMQTSLQKTQKLIDASLDIICSIDISGNFVFINAACQAILGYMPQEMTGSNCMSFIAPEDQAATAEAIAALQKGIAIFHFENHYRHKAGHYIPVAWSGRWDAIEQLIYCTARDISEKKKSEEKANHQQAKYYQAYKLASIGWWEVDGETHVATCSDELFEMYGLPKPANRVINRDTYFSIIPPEERPVVAYEMQQIFEKPVHEYEHHVLCPNGKTICVVHRAEAIKDKAGKVLIIHGTARDVTKEREAQKALQASEKKAEENAARLNEMLDNLGDGFVGLNRHFTITYWNRKTEELLGRKREDVLGKNLWNLYPESVNSVFYTEYNHALREQASRQFEAYFPLLSVWFEVSIYPSENQLSIFFKNIDEKRKREQALTHSNERFELASQATSDAIWDWDVATGIIYFNQNFTHIFGYANTTVNVDEGWVQNIHAEDRERVAKKMNSAHADPTVYHWEDEYRFCRANGTTAHVLDRGTIVRNGIGKAVRMIGAMADISRKKEAEEELKKLSLVAENTSNIVMITDAQEHIIWVNKAFTNITGYSMEEAVGNKPGALMQGPESSEQTRSYMRSCIKQQQKFHCEIVNYKKNGEKFWVEINGQPIFGNQGRLQQYFSLQTDITERKEVEEAIRISEQRYKLLFYESPKPKAIANAQTLCIVEANEAALKLYGYTRDELTNLTLLDLRVDKNINHLKTIIDKALNGEQFNVAYTSKHVKKSGVEFDIELSIHSLPLPAGLHIIAEGNDMTEKQELQRMLTEEKISAQKEVVKTIIYTQEKERSDIGKELHDNVNQILTTAKLYIENIRYFPDQREAFIEKSTSLVQKSINEIRALSKALVTPVINDLGFKETLQELVDQFSELSLFKIHFTFNTSGRIIEKGIQLTIYRIIQEQLNNIVKYALASQVWVSVTLKGTQLIALIEDDGIGFDTAKRNNGLGLNNIRNRAGAYQGQVQVQAAVGKGCKIEVVFPQ